MSASASVRLAEAERPDAQRWETSCYMAALKGWRKVGPDELDMTGHIGTRVLESLGPAN